MSRTKTYNIELNKKITFSMEGGNKHLISDRTYWCHRENNFVYVYGSTFGTKLTIRQARNHLSYQSPKPVMEIKSTIPLVIDMSDIEIYPLELIQKNAY